MEYVNSNKRPDCTIFYKREVIAFVEVKSFEDREKRLSVNDRQVKEYTSWGVPLLTITRWEQIDALMNRIKRMWKDYHTGFYNKEQKLIRFNKKAEYDRENQSLSWIWDIWENVDEEYK